MATSSIFTNIKIDTPDGAERFVDALDKSLEQNKKDKQEYEPLKELLTNPDDIKKLINKRLK